MGSIYKIINTVNGKAYIGQTRHDAEKTRIRDHLTGRGNIIIKNAVEKYGQDAFTFEILHDGIIPEFLDELEIEAIEKFNTLSPHGYNLDTGGGGGKKPSEETRRKQSEWQKGKKRGPLSTETRRKISEAHKGKYRSKEHCENISRSLKDRPSWHKGKKRSKEACERIGRASKGRTSPNKGKPRTQNEKENISRAVKHALTGKTHWNKGKSLSPETREKISHTKRSRPLSPEAREKMGRANRGKPRSKETREKMSRAKLGKSLSPDKEPAREFFFSLPAEMSLREKRRSLHNEFPQRGRSTLDKWVRQWEDEKI